MATKKVPSKAFFRWCLNELDKAERQREPEKDNRHVGPKGTRYRQVRRLYGDYLYHQDREKFEVDYAEWIAGRLAL